MFRDALFLMDWKTASSGSSKDTCKEIEKMYNDPVQVAAYVGAVNSDPNFRMLPEVNITFYFYGKEDLFEVDGNFTLIYRESFNDDGFIFFFTNQSLASEKRNFLFPCRV